MWCHICVHLHLRLYSIAAVQVLTSNDKSRAVNTSELLAQLLNVAVTCDGKCSSFFYGNNVMFTLCLVFTTEHRQQLSSIMDVHHPFVSHSPTSSTSGHSSRHEPGTPDRPHSQGGRVACPGERRVW